MSTHNQYKSESEAEATKELLLHRDPVEQRRVRSLANPLIDCAEEDSMEAGQSQIAQNWSVRKGTRNAERCSHTSEHDNSTSAMHIISCDIFSFFTYVCKNIDVHFLCE